jgi:hypothetical protein
LAAVSSLSITTTTTKMTRVTTISPDEGPVLGMTWVTSDSALITTKLRIRLINILKTNVAEVHRVWTSSVAFSLPAVHQGGFVVCCYDGEASSTLLRFSLHMDSGLLTHANTIFPLPHRVRGILPAAFDQVFLVCDTLASLHSVSADEFSTTTTWLPFPPNAELSCTCAFPDQLAVALFFSNGSHQVVEFPSSAELKPFPLQTTNNATVSHACCTLADANLFMVTSQDANSGAIINWKLSRTSHPEDGKLVLAHPVMVNIEMPAKLHDGCAGGCALLSSGSSLWMHDVVFDVALASFLSPSQQISAASCSPTNAKFVLVLVDSHDVELWPVHMDPVPSLARALQHQSTKETASCDVFISPHDKMDLPTNKQLGKLKSEKDLIKLVNKLVKQTYVLPLHVSLQLAQLACSNKWFAGVRALLDAGCVPALLHDDVHNIVLMSLLQHSPDTVLLACELLERTPGVSALQVCAAVKFALASAVANTEEPDKEQLIRVVRSALLRTRVTNAELLPVMREQLDAQECAALLAVLYKIASDEDNISDMQRALEACSTVLDAGKLGKELGPAVAGRLHDLVSKEVDACEWTLALAPAVIDAVDPSTGSKRPRVQPDYVVEKLVI